MRYTNENIIDSKSSSTMLAGESGALVKKLLLSGEPYVEHELSFS